LVRCGFVKDYTVWKYHGEGDPSATGASRGNSSTTSTAAAVNDGGQQPSSSATTVGGDNSNHDYIIQTTMVVGMVSRMMCWSPTMWSFFKILLTVWTRMTFCLGIRSGWRISKR
jgi:hypothetical protein